MISWFVLLHVQLYIIVILLIDMYAELVLVMIVVVCPF